MASDDWARRPPPRDISIPQLLHRNPRHSRCDLVIRTSAKNSSYVGLYCREHGHWFTWLNPQQVHYCEQLGIANPEGCASYSEPSQDQ